MGLIVCYEECKNSLFLSFDRINFQGMTIIIYQIKMRFLFENIPTLIAIAKAVC